VDLVVVDRGARADYAQAPVGARVRVLQDSRHSQPSVRAVGRDGHQYLALSRLHAQIIAQ
jgi:hypothetical protein